MRAFDLTRMSLRSLGFVPVLVSVLALSGCEDARSKASFAGYVEAQSLTISAPQSGWITDVSVDRGSEIRPGTLLFRLEDTQAKAQLKSAQGRYEAASATASDLSKGGRGVDIAPLIQQKREAEAALTLARSNQARYERLAPNGFVSQAKLESLRSATASAEAAVANLDRLIKQRETAARADQIASAKAAAEASSGDLAATQWSLEDRKVQARFSGRIDERLREPGEFVAAGSPVLTILPEGRTFVRFFVPQSELAKFKVGQTVKIACDGCAPQSAKVRFIAHEAQFTPPVIYSLKERQKLVFLIEATPDAPKALHAGQPVDVHL